MSWAKNRFRRLRDTQKSSGRARRVKCSESQRKMDFHRDREWPEMGEGCGKENLQYCQRQQRLQDNEELRTDHLIYKAPLSIQKSCFNWVTEMKPRGWELKVKNETGREMHVLSQKTWPSSRLRMGVQRPAIFGVLWGVEHTPTITPERRYPWRCVIV